MGDLSENFSRWEFECPCCGYCKPSPKLITRLQMVRDLIKKPIEISSGCRCESHNEAVGGVRGSSHVKGWAVDIVCPEASYRLELLEAALIAGFGRIGISDNFVHLDVDENKPQEVLWLY